MKKLTYPPIIIVLCVMLTGCFYEGKGYLKGEIRSSVGSYIQNAHVLARYDVVDGHWDNYGKIFRTDAPFGQYKLTVPPGPSWSLIAQHPDYISETRSSLEVLEDETTNCNFTLSRIPNKLLRIKMILSSPYPWNFELYIWNPANSHYCDFTGHGTGHCDSSPYIYCHRYGPCEFYIDIFQYQDGSYVIAAERSSMSSPSFSDFCTVKILRNNGEQIESDIIPPESSANNLWWHIVDINVQDGVPSFDIINTIQYSSPRPLPY